METVGGVFGLVTVTVTDELALAPAESVTLAVMRWVPAGSAFEKLAPAPIWPLRLEVQTIPAFKFPSSVSLALPANWMAVVVEVLKPVNGLLIVTAGGVFGLVTVTVTEAVALAPAESVTLAVIRWVPAGRALEKLAPVPIWPLRLEVQTIPALRLPSSTSVAVPVNCISVELRALKLFAGLLMETTGGVFGLTTVTVTDALALTPDESVT
jgi:preprotein translocase subunit YajC